MYTGVYAEAHSYYGLIAADGERWQSVVVTPVTLCVLGLYR